MTDDRYEKYEPMLNDLSRESGRMAWSSGSAASFYAILLIFIATVVARIFFPFAGALVTTFIFVAELIALFIPVALYYRRAGIYMREKCLELDETHPGFYDAYEKWRRRVIEESIST